MHAFSLTFHCISFDNFSQYLTIDLLKIDYAKIDVFVLHMYSLITMSLYYYYFIVTVVGLHEQQVRRRKRCKI